MKDIFDSVKLFKESNNKDTYVSTVLENCYNVRNRIFTVLFYLSNSF